MITPNECVLARVLVLALGLASVLATALEVELVLALVLLVLVFESFRQACEPSLHTGLIVGYGVTVITCVGQVGLRQGH
jgi:hypothetical protein